MAKKKMARGLIVLGGILLGAVGLSGCGNKTSDGKTEVEMISYKPEAVAAFEKIEERFNETHDDIHLTIESPNEAVTILKTRFIREDYAEIVGSGGDMNYSNFLDAGLFEDLSDLDVLKETKHAYLDMEEEALGQVAVMDSAVVGSDYRGAGLQGRMLQAAEARIDKEKYYYLMCTIHPDNQFSRQNMESQGYEVKKITQCYGGLDRCILV